ncbi:troponin T, cardiac muscle isoforms-like isoform X2 [Acanthaster planci]|uniref:Troponin T, cardiac muscle isoforms-like isoform X2 n=1 Tax=Acanthaster planci TaxID=133434 RepID=A0A8B7Y566_ACAPL|nr:troponin T, cardiac muscle isoforms-like isoform X2 [Acanthaster planci]
MAATEAEEQDALAVIKEQAEKRREEVNKELHVAREEYRRKKEEKEKELETLRAKREERRKQQAEERKMLEKFAEERRAKEKEEARKRKELADLKKKEREARIKAMHDPNAFKAVVIEKQEPAKKPKKSKEELAREKEEAMKERVQSLPIGANTAEDKIREIARNLLQRLQSIYSEIFDMKVRRKRQEYDHKELLQRIKDLTKHKEPVAAESSGTVHKFKELGVFNSQDQEQKSRLEKEKEAGSIMSSGGVAGRTSMFGGSTVKAPDEEG